MVAGHGCPERRILAAMPCGGRHEEPGGAALAGANWTSLLRLEICNQQAARLVLRSQCHRVGPRTLRGAACSTAGEIVMRSQHTPFHHLSLYIFEAMKTKKRHTSPSFLDECD